jgi:hypothetical protein
MSDLQRQHGQPVSEVLSPNHLSPRDARPDDFVIGSVSRTDAEYREALKDSEAVRADQSKEPRSANPDSPTTQNQPRRWDKA